MHISLVNEVLSKNHRCFRQYDLLLPLSNQVFLSKHIYFSEFHKILSSFLLEKKYLEKMLLNYYIQNEMLMADY